MQARYHSLLTLFFFFLPFKSRDSSSAWRFSEREDAKEVTFSVRPRERERKRKGERCSWLLVFLLSHDVCRYSRGREFTALRSSLLGKKWSRNGAKPIAEDRGERQKREKRWLSGVEKAEGVLLLAGLHFRTRLSRQNDWEENRRRWMKLRAEKQEGEAREKREKERGVLPAEKERG